VLSRAEVQAVPREMSGHHLLMARLLYGSGMRLMEILRLRVKDIDFEQSQLVVRDGKGEKDRFTMLAGSRAQPGLGRAAAKKIIPQIQRSRHDVTSRSAIIGIHFN